MIKFNIINPTSSRPTVGESESLSNYGIVVPREVFRAARNTTMIDIHVRQAIQDRPYHYFMGSAEHLLLDPLASIVAKGGDPLSFMLQLAKDLNAVSKGISLMRSGVGVKTISQVYSSLLPSTTTPGEFVRAVEESDKSGEMVSKTGLGVFSNFFSDLLTKQGARDNIFKSFKVPNPTIVPGIPITKIPTQDTINRMFAMFEVFGMAGKRQPLFGEEITPVLARRFTVEHYLFTEPGTKFRAYQEDCRVASAIWYLMYDQIVKTPESYDAALPIVPPSPQDSQVAAQILKMLGTFTHTSISAATAPIYMDAILAIRQLNELVEFLSTGPIHDPEEVAKIKKTLNDCNAMVTEAAYAPVVSLSNATFDYVKKLTSARYLLPEFLTSIGTVADPNAKPFGRMDLPTEIALPENFRGTVDNCERITEFGGMDIPVILEDVRRKAADLQAGLIQLAQMRTTLHSGMASQFGNVITHLDTLGQLTPDPVLGSLEYPSPTRVYITPTYVPKYKLLANSLAEWAFSSANLMYKPFFPIAYQYDQIQKNMGRQAFAWDTEVNLPPSPATGSDYACLLIPYNYVDDCSSKSISNDIASVGQELSSSPHRPMKQITDFFTPLFHALNSGLVKHEVLANAVSSMFSIYKKTSKTSKAAAFDDAAAWEVIKPQIPFVYGHPTSSLLEANAPWASNTSYPCKREHVHISRDGKFMLVLHRALPKPTTLSYVPFTLDGGIKVSLPVNRTSYTTALAEVSKSKFTDPETFYSAMFERLLVAKLKNNLVEVKSWAPSFAFFPHIFVTNRHVTSATGAMLSAVPQMMQRLVLSTDDAAPYGGVMSYFHTPVIAFDNADEMEAVTSPELSIDINETIKSQSSKAVVNTEDTGLPTTKLNEEAEPIQKVNEVPVDIATHTGPEGTIIASNPPAVGAYDPEITDEGAKTNPNS